MRPRSARRRSFAYCAPVRRHPTNKGKARLAKVKLCRSGGTIQTLFNRWAARDALCASQHVDESACSTEESNATTTNHSTRQPGPDGPFPQLGMAPNPRHDDLWRWLLLSWAASRVAPPIAGRAIGSMRAMGGAG